MDMSHNHWPVDHSNVGWSRQCWKARPPGHGHVGKLASGSQPRWKAGQWVKATLESCTPVIYPNHVVKLLLKSGNVDPDSKDTRHSRTPLSWAAEKGHEA